MFARGLSALQPNMYRNHWLFSVFRLKKGAVFRLLLAAKCARRFHLLPTRTVPPIVRLIRKGSRVVFVLFLFLFFTLHLDLLFGSPVHACWVPAS